MKVVEIDTPRGKQKVARVRVAFLYESFRGWRRTGNGETYYVGLAAGKLAVSGLREFKKGMRRSGVANGNEAVFALTPKVWRDGLATALAGGERTFDRGVLSGFGSRILFAAFEGGVRVEAPCGQSVRLTKGEASGLLDAIPVLGGS